jgi:DSF synthase
MLFSLDETKLRSKSDFPLSNTAEITHLDIEFEERHGILWKFISAASTPHFCHEQLDDIRAVQAMLRDRSFGDGPGRANNDPVRYVVFGSRIPGVFSLGGDLRLFRELIANRDRAGLARYSRKATDAVYYHACNPGNTTSISLVQGVAMGGGFEAALAGNLLVAERGSRLGFPEVLFGLFPGMGAYTFLRRRVDAATAESIIVSAKNYTAEDLHDMGIVDILCAPGEGEHAIRSYVSRQASRPGAAAFRRAINCARPIDRNELYGIAEAWVDTALQLDTASLRRIDRLITNQDRKFEQAAPEPALIAV